VWNDGPNNGATGGGASSLFPVPSWQNGLSIPATANGQTGRGIPDVAADASPRTGYRIYFHGVSIVFGGTSASAPLWAGLMALMNQGLGQDIGFLNPGLYQKLGRSGAFRFIKEGNNSYGGVTGYSAGPGWNPCAGWGTPDGRKLLAALKEFFPPKTPAPGD
jgi:kumamolisin